MISLRSIFVVLVLAQIAASAIGSIVGSFLRNIIVPSTELLIGSVGKIMIGRMDVSDFISTLLLALLMIVVSIMLLGLFVRIVWPPAVKFLKLELPTAKDATLTKG